MQVTTTDTPMPTWEPRHRLARALEWAQVDKADMADYLGVSRQTIDNYLKGRTQPTIGYVRNWANRCGVPVSWLVSGTADTESDIREYLEGIAELAAA